MLESDFPHFILVQPWFSAQGHPAQSLLNLGRIVPRERLSYFLISSFDTTGPFARTAEKLAAIAPVRVFRAAGVDLRRNTVLAALQLMILSLSGKAGRAHTPLFVDCDIFALCLLLRFGVLRFLAPPAVILLHGPERLEPHKKLGRLVRRVLVSSRSTIFLRSQEHLAAWNRACPGARFRPLPPVEASLGEMNLPANATPTGTLRLGVLGQLRAGKSIPQLLALAERDPDRMAVTVRGPLFQQQSQEFLDFARGHPSIRAGYMSEDELLEAAQAQDYLACLFEESWDLSSESATFWLAVKVNRPVVSFADGWVADMVRMSGGGVVLSDRTLDDLAAHLPRRDSREYQALCDSMRHFRESLAPEAVWAKLYEAMT